ncbi:MAG: FkbM family methyltransferase [Bacteroidales bacterium]|nr:FkbM family methyltransferase [Bacteroidales bacterium]
MRIVSLLKISQIVSANKDKSHLYRIKLLFPFWLRRFIFSSFNPLYTFYKKKNQNYTINYPSMHPMAIDFICYSLTENIHFDTTEYYPDNDVPTIIEYIDNRIKSVLSYPSQKMNENQFKTQLHNESLSKKVKKHGYYYSLLHEEIQYEFSNIAEVATFDHHYGLKRLPEITQKYINGKDFLDIGAAEGDTAIMLLQYNPRKVFAYEPVAKTYQKLLVNSKLWKDKIVAVKKGIGDEETTMEININPTNEGANTVKKNLSIGFSRKKIEKIDIITIDKECKDRNIGLIKMDIEGFEYYAVKGGLETIKRDKPVLFISIYHTGKDFFEIPPLLKSHVPEYKFRMIDNNPTHPIAEWVLIAYI